jgi:pimeloyl-ACP methyl ester carboxylesterase
MRRATVSDAGHFVHMEQPQATADLLLGFLDS